MNFGYAYTWMETGDCSLQFAVLVVVKFQSCAKWIWMEVNTTVTINVTLKKEVKLKIILVSDK